MRYFRSSVVGTFALTLIALAMNYYLSFYVGQWNGLWGFSAPELPRICKSFYAGVCERPGITRDPTGYVRSDSAGEKEALRIRQRLLAQNPKLTLPQINDALAREIYTSPRLQELRDAFAWVRNSMEDFIDRQPHTVFTPREKRHLKARLYKTRLQLPPPASVYADEPDLLHSSGVFYERSAGSTEYRLRVGGGYLLSVKSWFNLIFTIAHELGHVIDPCELRVSGITVPAYDRLTACFLDQKLIASRTTRSECGRNDQLSETFADWMAVQITAEALAARQPEFQRRQLASAALNTVRDLCEPQDGSWKVDTEYHPSPMIRIDRIFGNNPEIRRVLGCSESDSAVEYCSFESKIQN